MAPIKPEPTSSKPSARALRLARISGAIHPLLPSKIFRPDAAVSDSFISSKHDKRLIRHSAFVSRITSAPPARVTKRRPVKSIFSTSKSSSKATSKSNNASASKTTPKPNNASASKTTPKPNNASTSKTTSKSNTSKPDSASRSSNPSSDKPKRPRRNHTPLSTSLAALADALPTPVDTPALRSLVSKKGALRRKERVIRDEMYRFGASMARLNSSTCTPESTNAMPNPFASGSTTAMPNPFATTSAFTRSSAATRTSSTPLACTPTSLAPPTPSAPTNTFNAINQDSRMDGVEEATAPSQAQSDKWAALRGFISETMDHNPALRRK